MVLPRKEPIRSWQQVKNAIAIKIIKLKFQLKRKNHLESEKKYKQEKNDTAKHVYATENIYSNSMFSHIIPTSHIWKKFGFGLMNDNILNKNLFRLSRCSPK